MSDGEEVRCVGKLLPQIGGEDWEGPLADGSKVEGWHDQLVGGRRSKSHIKRIDSHGYHRNTVITS